MYESIDIEGKKLVGRGAHCEVYQMSEDRVLKLYFDYVPESDVIREQKLARFAVSEGIRTAGVYDIYRYHDRLGLMFEYIPTCTLTQYLADHRDDVDHYAEELAKTAKKLHSTKDKNSECDDYKITMHKRVNDVERLYTKREIKKLHAIVDAIPDRDTLLHTDFHPGNLMMKGNELVFIDMADISRGHPIFDIASAYMGLVILPLNIKKYGDTQTANLDFETTKRIWDVFIREYLGQDNEDRIELYEKCCEAITGLRICAAKRINNKGGEAIGRKVVWISRFTIFPKLTKYRKLLKLI